MLPTENQWASIDWYHGEYKLQNTIKQLFAANPHFSPGGTGY
jgi:hypothetical protein